MSTSAAQNDIIVFVTHGPRPKAMNKSMMVRTDHAQILGTVILHLGNGLDVMNFKHRECRGRVIPFIRSRLCRITTINLAIRSHQINDQLSQTRRPYQPLVCLPSAHLSIYRIDLLHDPSKIPTSQRSTDRALPTHAILGHLLTNRCRFKEAPVAPGHTYQCFFSGPSWYARLNELTNVWASNVRISRMQPKSARNYPTIEQFHG